MLTGITTRTSTPQEDDEQWPGGSARPVLACLTGTLVMIGADARELLKAARTAQAEAGPGALADYPIPGGDAHLLIHYAPGSRAYRFKLTAPGNDVPPGGSPSGDAAGAPAPGLPAPPGITVTIWHNVAHDAEGRHTAMLDGYQLGDPMVRVFAYQASPGRSAEETAEEAFTIFNDHPATLPGQSWPAPTTGAGSGRCRSPETHRVASGRVAFTVAPCGPDRRRGRRASRRPASVSQVQGGRTNDGQDLAAAGAAARPARGVRRG